MEKSAFISYSHVDEKLLERFHKHLSMLKRDGSLDTWSDNDISAGLRVNLEIFNALDRSDIFIALISPDYLASNYCYDNEFQRALERERLGYIQIIPVILEPCDWMSSPFKDFLALPKDGVPISTWTNQNNAFLSVVTGIRSALADLSRPEHTASQSEKKTSSRKPRVMQDFDAVQRSEFAEVAFIEIRDYFQKSCGELTGFDENLRAKFENMTANSFTCTVVNRAKRDGEDADITVHLHKDKHMFGDISYKFERYSTSSSMHGAMKVDSDDYSLFLNPDVLSISGKRDSRCTPLEVAESLWTEFVGRAGIRYD